MKIRFVVDGNITGWVSLSLIVLGIAMTCSGLAFHSLPKIIAIILVIFGLPIASVGGYASRAKALNLKPFDKSFRQTRDSYDVRSDKQEK